MIHQLVNGFFDWLDTFAVTAGRPPCPQRVLLVVTVGEPVDVVLPAPQPNEEEILARYSTPRLRRNLLPREAKRLNMEFDAQFNKMTIVERDEFLDGIYSPKGE